MGSWLTLPKYARILLALMLVGCEASSSVHLVLPMLAAFATVVVTAAAFALILRGRSSLTFIGNHRWSLPRNLFSCQVETDCCRY